MTETNFENENVQIATDAIGQASVQLGQDLEALRVNFEASARESAAFANDFSRGLRGAFRDVIVEGESLADSLSNLARSMANQALNRAIAPVADAVGDGIAGFVGSILPFERGGVVDQGNIRAFASGGVVGGPTLFPMMHGTGVMGEAGPEAIMPLRRGADGKLGVAGAGGGQNITVNFAITTADAKSFAQSQNQIGTRLRQVIAQSVRVE